MPATATLDRPWAPPAPVAPVTVDARWRDALARRLGIGGAALRATAGDTRLDGGAAGTWRFFDTIVTDAPSHGAGPAAGRFSTTYGAVVHNLVAQPGDGLRQVLGAHCASWQAFRSDPAHLPLHLPRLSSGAIDVTGVLAMMFQTWAIGLLHGDDLRAAMTELRRPDVACAATALHAAAGGTFAWTTTDGDRSTPATARPMTVRFSAGDLAVHVHLDAVWRVDGRPAAPGAPGRGPDAGTVPWFDPAALALAHEDGTPAVWRRRAPTWTETFGTQGNLRRVVTGLVVAEGIDVTVARRSTCIRPRPGSSIDNDVDRAGPSFATDGCGEGRREHPPLSHWTSTRGEPRVIGLLTSPIQSLLPAR